MHGLSVCDKVEGCTLPLQFLPSGKRANITVFGMRKYTQNYSVI